MAKQTYPGKPDIAITDLVKQAEKKANEKGNNEAYSLRSRVKRWMSHYITLEVIRNFTDNGLPTYANQTDEALWRQQAFHDLRGIAKLLLSKAQPSYFIKTPKGQNAAATLVLILKENKKREVYEGTLEIGMDKDAHKIYHLMFNSNQNRLNQKISSMPLIEPDKYGQEKENKIDKSNKNDTKGFQAYKIKGVIIFCIGV